MSPMPTLPKVARRRETERGGELFSAARRSAGGESISRREDGPVERLSVAELRSLACRVANGLGLRLESRRTTPLPVYMPMTAEAVAIYLAHRASDAGGHSGRQLCPRRGCRYRLELGKATLRLHAGFAFRLGKKLPLSGRVPGHQARRSVVLPCCGSLDCKLAGEGTWRGRSSFHSRPTTTQCPVIRAKPARSCSLRARADRPKPFPGIRPPPIKAAVNAHFAPRHPPRATSFAGRATWAG